MIEKEMLGEYEIPTTIQEINVEELRSLQKELTGKQIIQEYQLSEELFDNICKRFGLSFRKTKKKIATITI